MSASTNSMLLFGAGAITGIVVWISKTSNLLIITF